MLLGRFEISIFLLQVLVIVFYGVFTEYGANVHPAVQVQEDVANLVQGFYPFFQDVHVMVFVGFGYLMVFLKQHSWTSVAYNFFIAAFTIQITILISGFWHMALDEDFEKIQLNLPSLIIADFGAAAVLITFGAILGKCNLFQLLILACIEIIFYALNEAIGVTIFKAVDMGGSMYVHTFGAYFGLAAAYFIRPTKARCDPDSQEFRDNTALNGASYNSNLLAMIGTLFLWMYWPSFNGALANGS